MNKLREKYVIILERVNQGCVLTWRMISPRRFSWWKGQIRSEKLSASWYILLWWLEHCVELSYRVWLSQYREKCTDLPDSFFSCEILLQSARNASKNRGSNEAEGKYFGLENLWSSPEYRKSFVNADYEVSSFSALHCSFKKLNPANGLLVTRCACFCSHSGEEHLFLKFIILLYVMPS